MNAKTNRRARTDALRRAWAAHNPLQAHPPLRWWHGVILALAVFLMALAVLAPGVLSDLASTPIADWRWFVRARSTVIILCLVALVGVRAYHWLIGVAMVLSVAGMCLRIGLGQMTQEPLTLGFALLLLALAIIPVRVILRPNDTDLITQQAEEIRTLRRRVGDEP